MKNTQALNDEFFTPIYKKYKDNIEKYVDQKDPNFSFGLFKDILKFYLKWSIYDPWMKIKFLDNILGTKFDNNSMRDLILKGKPTKVNFCYLPQLEVDNQKIGPQYYVFTYKEGETFIKEDIDYEKVGQISMDNY